MKFFKLDCVVVFTRNIFTICALVVAFPKFMLENFNYWETGVSKLRKI
jgi:hypothetical protein